MAVLKLSETLNGMPRPCLWITGITY